MKRTKLFVRLTGLGEAKAEGGMAILALGLWAAVATWVLSRWEEAMLALLGTSLISVIRLLRSIIGQS